MVMTGTCLLSLLVFSYHLFLFCFVFFYILLTWKSYISGASFSKCDAFNSLIKWKTGSDSFVIGNATSEMMMLDEIRSMNSSPSCSRAYIYTSSPGRTVLQATLAKEFHYFDKSLSESIDLKATLSIGAYLPLSVRQDSDGNHHGGYWFDKTQEEIDNGVSKLYLVPGTYVDVMLLGGPERWGDNVEFTETVKKVNEDEEDLTSGVNVHHNFDRHANMYRILCQTLGSYVSFRHSMQLCLLFALPFYI